MCIASAKQGNLYDFSDYVYSDTDSVKYIGNVDFSEYNAEKIRNSTASGAYAVDAKGKTHYMGVYEVEYLFEFFIGFLLIGELLQFNSLDALEHMGVAGDESPHLHKRPHDTDADLYGYIAP